MAERLMPAAMAFQKRRSAPSYQRADALDVMIDTLQNTAQQLGQAGE
ncbi:hypothetical protein [Rahnella sp. AA]|nr:hypothetical protein [Rahnella sp. AA]